MAVRDRNEKIQPQDVMNVARYPNLKERTDEIAPSIFATPRFGLERLAVRIMFKLAQQEDHSFRWGSERYHHDLICKHAFGPKAKLAASFSSSAYRSCTFVSSDTRHQPFAARALGIGFYAGSGLLHGRVVIPIHNERGDLLAYAGRTVNGEAPKYRFPSGFHKSQALFNLNRARQAGEPTVIVVEGFFDTAKVHQAGHSAVVGLMGSSLSDEQARLLQNHFDRAVLMLDGDGAGQRATALIIKRLSNEIEVAVVTLERGAQPDQLASREINLLLNGCV